MNSGVMELSQPGFSSNNVEGDPPPDLSPNLGNPSASLTTTRIFLIFDTSLQILLNCLGEEFCSSRVAERRPITFYHIFRRHARGQMHPEHPPPGHTRPGSHRGKRVAPRKARTRLRWSQVGYFDFFQLFNLVAEARGVLEAKLLGGSEHFFPELLDERPLLSESAAEKPLSVLRPREMLRLGVHFSSIR